MTVDTVWQQDRLETAEQFQEFFDAHDKNIIATIDAFSDYVREVTDWIVFPGYCFDHIALGDYNLDDSDIKWCMADERVNDHLISQYTQLDEEHSDHTSDETGRNYQYWQLVDGTQWVMNFLQWVLTIPEDERYKDMPWFTEFAT
jgi:hypothetical protein